MRKIFFILCICFVAVLQSIVFALPSDWATELIEESIGDNIVPIQLQSDYQHTVKRYEYVLLALEILEQNNVDVVIANDNPFTDIAGHKYEQEIIMAYNANIIGGYEDRTFKPDNEIKREEIAALVFNIVKKINPYSAFPTIDAKYSDRSQISNWAINYVEFCYKNKIIAGIGKDSSGLDKIDPLGKATREQAIILLYKVSINKELIAKYEFEPIEVIAGIGEAAKTSEDINRTATNIGYSVVIEAVEISKKENVEFAELDDNFFALNYNNFAGISVLDSKYQREINLKITDLNNDEIKKDYMDLLSTYFPNHVVSPVLVSVVNNFELDNEYVLNMSLSDGGYVSAYSDTIEGTTWYYIKYKRDK